MEDTVAEDHFEKLYQTLKLEITDKMRQVGYGNVEVRIANIPGYISKLWRDMALARLNVELAEEFGVEKVYFQDQNTEENKDPAFIVVG